MDRMQLIIFGIPYGDFPKEKLKLREQNDQIAMFLHSKLGVEQRAWMYAVQHRHRWAPKPILFTSFHKYH